MLPNNHCAYEKLYKLNIDPEKGFANEQLTRDRNFPENPIFFSTFGKKKRKHLLRKIVSEKNLDFSAKKLLLIILITYNV